MMEFYRAGHITVAEQFMGFGKAFIGTRSLAVRLAAIEAGSDL